MSEIEKMERDGSPPPSSHVAALEKEVKDLKHNLAGAEGRAKNATSNCDYWKAQYEALAKGNPSPQPNVAGDVVKPLLATRFKLSFDSKGRCTTFRKDQAETLEGQWVWLIEATNGMNDPLRTANSDAIYELRKFFAQTVDWADENGWTEAACQKDRIVDWFGPSDFLEMRQMIERLEALEDQS